MKDKVLTFVIGFLVGAIVATAGYIVYEKVKDKNVDKQFQEGNGGFEMMRPNGKMEDMENMPELPSGEMPKDMPQFNEGENPSEKDDEQKMQNRKNKSIENQEQNETSV